MIYKSSTYNKKTKGKRSFSQMRGKSRRLRKYPVKKSWSRARRGKDSLKVKVKKIIGITAGIFFVLIFVGTVLALSIVAKYSAQLPEPDAPFAKSQNLTSTIYDRNENKLYDVYDDENREVIDIKDVPDQVKWAFLAAEDIDFYHHKGVDLSGIARCALKNMASRNPVGCGGSTITQQMIRNTVITNERTYERKIKEIILSLRIEQKYSKDEVLGLYLNTIGFGGNIYGIKTASRVYFGKDIKDLTLGEASLLAGLPQAPGIYSPLFAADIESAREKAVQRQGYVLDQMLEKKDKINNEVGDSNFITKEKIEVARNEQLVYQRKEINLEAGHFVFYVEQELQSRNYNDGRPFTQAEIERGGYKFVTTLDLDMQKLAEESIRAGVENFQDQYYLHNASLVSMDPKTGEILAMVGSKDYFGDNYPQGCIEGKDCLFEGNVNVALSSRQPGSSIKPLHYYTAFAAGKTNPATLLPDVQVDFGNYVPQNAEAGFWGPVSQRLALQASRNIPAVENLGVLGVENFTATLHDIFGYTTLNDVSNYGLALALGAGDVTLVEHTAAYSVFAANGVYHTPQPILRIYDKDGKLIYDYENDPEIQGRKVADDRAVYLINNVLSDKSYTNAFYDKKWIADYPLAGKSGTTDNNKNVWYMGYSPEIVTGVWAGNNDNSDMDGNAWCIFTALPIWNDYMNKVIWRYPKTQFYRPAGIVSYEVCADSGKIPTDVGCGTAGTKSELFIQSFPPEKDDMHVKLEVCKDQPDHLARDIDRDLGLAETRVFTHLKMPKEEWQPFLDKAIAGNAIPTEPCTINRNPSGNEGPWIEVIKPTEDQVIVDRKLSVEIAAYSTNGSISQVEVYIDSTKLSQATNIPYIADLTLPDSITDGVHTFKAIAYDVKGLSSVKTVSIQVGVVESIQITQPAEGATLPKCTTLPVQTSKISVVYSGKTNLTSVTLKVLDTITNIEYNYVMQDNGGGNYSYDWAPPKEGSFRITAIGKKSGGSQLSSSPVNVIVELKICSSPD